MMCYKDPESHPYITGEEKEYLLKELGQLSRSKDLPSTPWSDMIDSVPLYALIVGQIGRDWAFFLLNTDLPKYLNDVLEIRILENGFYSALPFFVMLVVSIFFGWFCDIMIRMRCMSISDTRKFFTFVGNYYKKQISIFMFNDFFKI